MEFLAYYNDNDHQPEPEPALKKTKGKQKIEIKRIDRKNRRQVTFSKRREGLFKKCGELSSLHGAEVAVIAFSEAGKLYSFGNPDPHSVLQRYIDDHNKNNNNSEAGECRGFWWDEVKVDNLELGQLEEFKVALENLKTQVLMLSSIEETNRASTNHASTSSVSYNQGVFAYNLDGQASFGCDEINNYHAARSLAPLNHGYGFDNLDFGSVITTNEDASSYAAQACLGFGNPFNNYGMLPQVTKLEWA